VKVLYLPLNAEGVVQTGMYDAFNNYGVNLKIFDYNNIIKKNVNERLVKEVIDFKPELIHTQMQYTDIISNDALVEIKKALPNVFITNWTGDVANNANVNFIKKSKVVDLCLISSVGQLDMYRKECSCPVEYWQIGYNPKLYFPKNKNNFIYDIAFTANNFIQNYPGAEARRNFVKIASRYNLGLFGGGWGDGIRGVSQAAVNDIYSDSFSCLSISHFNDLQSYYSDRLLMCIASGRPTFCYRFPEWEYYFSDMKNIVIFQDEDEFTSKLDFLLKNKNIADDIGKNGAEIAKREHTYFSRVVELFNILKRYL